MDRKTQLEQELQRVADLIIRDYDPEQVILFGSLAGGAVHEWSDIDLAVVKRTPRRFLDRIGEVLHLVHQEVVRMAADDHSFWTDEIVKKGKVLYDRAA